MSTDHQSILRRLKAVHAGLLKAAAEHGPGRSTDRWLWDRAKAGWVPVRDLHDSNKTDADRQRFSRAIRSMVQSGQLEAYRDEGGKIIDVRIPEPVTSKRGKQR